MKQKLPLLYNLNIHEQQMNTCTCTCTEGGGDSCPRQASQGVVGLASGSRVPRQSPLLPPAPPSRFWCASGLEPATLWRSSSLCGNRRPEAVELQDRRPLWTFHVLRGPASFQDVQVPQMLIS